MTGTVASAASVPWSGVTSKPSLSCSWITTTVLAGGGSQVHSATCPGNTTLTGGSAFWGNCAAGEDCRLSGSYPDTGNKWMGVGYNGTAFGRVFYVIAVCCML